MKKLYLIVILFSVLIFILNSCSDSDKEIIKTKSNIKTQPVKNTPEQHSKNYPRLLKLFKPSFITNVKKQNFVSSAIKINSDTQIEKNIYKKNIVYQSEGLAISGLIYEPVKKNKIGVIIAHGYYNPKYYIQGQGTKETAVKLAELGYTTIISDYRNYGHSEKKQSFPYPGEAVDVLNSVLSFKNMYKDKIDKYYLIGYSWGGGIALTAIEILGRAVDGLILYYPQLGGVKMSKRDYNYIKSYGLTDREIAYIFVMKSPLYNTVLVQVPVLIFHGKKDKTVSIRQSEKLLENLKKENKVKVQFYPDDEYGHAFADNPDNRTLDKLIKFMQ